MFRYVCALTGVMGPLQPPTLIYTCKCIELTSVTIVRIGAVGTGEKGGGGERMLPCSRSCTEL